MAQTEDRKRIEQAEYRAKLIEAELNAVKGSRSYQLSRKLGIIKAQIQKDPVGLTRKAARLFLTNPQKARHIFRSANRGAFITQSVADQTAKYQEWILLHEPDEEDQDKQRIDAGNLYYRPLISIVTPVFNPPADVLEELIESVLDQTYTEFELCLGNFGDSPEIKEVIARYAALDKRVKDYVFSENLGIAANSNKILEKVKGEFIALLDHDDTLAPNALYENVKLLNQKPYDFIYSDKDKIDEKGNRFDPLFKPELSPEMLLNINFLTHLNVMRTSLVRKIGGWDVATNGAQDWDIFLRVVSEAKHVGFIPKVLYHWRVIATSTAMSIDTKPYALENQRKAVDKYLAKHTIPAHAYLERTELILKWDSKSVESSPFVFLYFSNLANTQRVMRSVKKVTTDPQFVVLVQNANDAAILTRSGLESLKYTPTTAMNVVGEYLADNSSHKATTAVFLSDAIHFTKNADWYEKLSGWLSIPDVAAVSGRLVDRRDLIVNSGGLVASDGNYFPLFIKYPRYYQSYLGNSEWVRNLSVLSSRFFATSVSDLRTFSNGQSAKKAGSFDNYFLWISGTQKKRLVMTPHATAIAYSEVDIDKPHSLAHMLPSGFIDPFSNPNMALHDPLRLFDDEDLAGLPSTSQKPSPDAYQHDAIILADTFDIASEQIAANMQVQGKHFNAPKSVAFFLPSFDGLYAGLMNIFSFANYLSATHQVEVTVYILKGDKDIAAERGAVTAVFPQLRSAKFVAIVPDADKAIGAHDWGIATQWSTAFPLAKTARIDKKLYFIQDNEANFYPKGSVSALVELTYRFGFTAIAGTEGLLAMYRKTYGGDGVVLQSKIDLSAYHPRKDLHYTPKKPYRVFFYARPGMPRNAFELGVAGLKRLKQELGSEVEIITAGAEWDPDMYGVQGLFTNLGKIAYQAVPKLYRSVDAGLMFMFSGHPGVTASELMASGCPVVVNEYDDVTWHELYQHEQTCVVTAPTATEIARSIKRTLTDQELRNTIIDGGLKKAKVFYAGYDASLGEVYRTLTRQ